MEADLLRLEAEEAEHAVPRAGGLVLAVAAVGHPVAHQVRRDADVRVALQGRVFSL